MIIIKLVRFLNILYIFLFCMVLAVPLLAAAVPGMAPPSKAVSVTIPPVLKNAPELTRLVRHWDNQSILAIEIARQAPRQVLNRSDMARARIENDGSVNSFV